jgi:TRAP-type C4-dicarboxylate transport system permease small subunit
VPLIDQIGDPLKVVATAVTPVVMVSATAILISGVNTRYISISDRVRSLAREYREVNTPSNRRSTIRLEMVVFHRRLHLVSWAARVLYTAVGCFIAVALLISVSLSKPIPAGITLAAFLIGLTLTAVAIILQLLELQQSNRTIDLESADVLDDLEK